MERKENDSLIAEVTNTETCDPNDPVILGFTELVFMTAGGIQPGSPNYEAAQRVLTIITGEKPNLDNLSSEDLVRIFRARGMYCERYLI